jgi:multiple sugar transport system permease protein
MFAFILCPDEKMWTLMVFLYNLQYRGHMGLTFAALLVAAIPTFLVFVFCQNIIIRGIVVPVEK